MWFCITTQPILRSTVPLFLSEMQLLSWRRKSQLFKLINFRHSWQRRMLQFRSVGILINLHSSQNFFFLSHYSDFVMPPEQDLLLGWCYSDAIMLLSLNRETNSLRTEISCVTKRELNTEMQHARFSHINSQGQKRGERKFF